MIVIVETIHQLIGGALTYAELSVGGFCTR